MKLFIPILFAYLTLFSVNPICAGEDPASQTENEEQQNEIVVKPMQSGCAGISP